MTTQNRKEWKRAVQDLVLIEAAVEGADMGDKELQEVITCRLLNALTVFQSWEGNAEALKERAEE